MTRHTWREVAEPGMVPVGMCSECGAVAPNFGACQGAELTQLRAALARAESERDGLRVRVEEAQRVAAAAVREADRWRHGVPIEGDYVCPDSLALEAARAESATLRRDLAAARGAVVEERERIVALLADERATLTTALDLRRNDGSIGWERLDAGQEALALAIGRVLRTPAPPAEGVSEDMDAALDAANAEQDRRAARSLAADDDAWQFVEPAATVGESCVACGDDHRAWDNQGAYCGGCGRRQDRPAEGEVGP